MLKYPSVNELASILDTVKHGLDRSEFGPLMMDGPTGLLQDKKVNSLAAALLPLILKAVLEKVEFEGVDNKTKKEG